MEKMDAVIRQEGRCCSCGSNLRDTENMNLVTLDKYAQWEFPAWGNVLAKDEEKRMGNRACAVLCDGCVDPEKGVILKPVKEAIEIAEIEGRIYIYYHPIDKLKDAPPILAEDLKDHQSA